MKQQCICRFKFQHNTNLEN
nr:DUF3709 domain-containing protein [Vibrio navarrensis]